MKLTAYIGSLLILATTGLAQDVEFEIVKKRKRIQYEFGITALTVNKPIANSVFSFAPTRAYALYSPGLFFSVGKNNQFFRVSFNYNRYSSSNFGMNVDKDMASRYGVLYSITHEDLRFSYLTIGNTKRFLSLYFCCELNVGRVQSKTAGAEQYYYYFGFGAGPSLQFGTATHLGFQFNCSKKLLLRLESGLEYNFLRNIASNSYAYRDSKMRWQIASITCGLRL